MRIIGEAIGVLMWMALQGAAFGTGLALVMWVIG